MSAVVEFVGDAFEDIGDAVGDVLEFVGDTVERVVDSIGENPLLAVAAIAAPYLAPELFALEGLTAAELLPEVLGPESLSLTGALEGAAGAGAGAAGAGYLDTLGGTLGADAAGASLGTQLSGGLSGSLGSQLAGIPAAATETGSVLPEILGAESTSLTMPEVVAPSAFEASTSAALPQVAAPSVFEASTSPLASQAGAPVVDLSVSATQLPPLTQNPYGVLAEETLSSPLSSIKKLGGDAIDFMNTASKTPTGQALKTVGNLASGVNAVEGILNAEKQRQLMDAQLEAYRTSGLQSGQASSQKALPSSPFGVRNYAGQYGIGI